METLYFGSQNEKGQAGQILLCSILNIKYLNTNHISFKVKGQKRSFKVTGFVKDQKQYLHTHYLILGMQMKLGNQVF